MRYKDIFFVIYFPVWIDSCSPHRLRTIWLAVMFVSAPLGIVLGYATAAVSMTFTSWKWAFLAESILLIAPVCILFIMIPS